MADGTKIEWTEATWNPITGCSVTSPGCTNCYAMRLAGSRLQHHPSRIGLTDLTKAGPVWNGKVRFNEQWLTQPLKWSRPRMVFVCAHGDLFHESVPFEWIDQVFAVMAFAPQHTFQVLTKRADRMRNYMTALRNEQRAIIDKLTALHETRGEQLGHALATYDQAFGPVHHWRAPNNIWLGVSAENQETLYERVPMLLTTPAAVRWLSAEPLLGPIDLNAIEALIDKTRFRRTLGRYLDWVVVGGESGPSARPMDVEWARALARQCGEARTPFFFKQMGGRGPKHTWAPIPEDLQVRQFPTAIGGRRG